MSAFLPGVLVLAFWGWTCAQQLPPEVVAQLGYGWINAVALAPDGKSVFVATPVGIYGFHLPHLAPHQVEYVLGPHKFERPSSLAVSPDGKLIACGTQSGKVLFWRTPAITWREWPLEPVKVGEEPVSALAFSGDGLLLAAGTGEEVVLVDLLTGDQRRSPSLGGAVLALLFAPDNQSIRALVEGKGVSIVNIHSMEQIKLIEIERASSLAFSSDGTVWVGTTTGKVYRISVDSAELVFAREQPAEVQSLAIGDGWLALGLGREFGSRVEVWDPRNGSLLFEYPETRAWKRVWVGAGEGWPVLLCVPGYYVLESWSTETWTRRAMAAEFSDVIPAVGFLLGGRQLIAPSYDGFLRIWDVSSRKVLRVLPGTGGSIGALAVSTDGNWAAWNGGGGVVVYHAPSGEERVYSNAWLTGGGSVTAVAFSPDGSRLAANSWNCIVLIWKLPKGQRLVPPVIGDCFYVAKLAFSPDGRTLAAGSYEGSIMVWDVARRKRKAVLEAGGELSSLAFSPDGRWLAAGAERIIRIWDSSSYTKLTELALGFDPWDLAFLPNRDVLLVVGGYRLALWSTSTWTNLRTIDLPFYGRGLAISPDGKLLATSHGEGVVLLWDLDALLSRR